jgi:DNA polymerase I-like protein with 3'-5' exonuclease and polymerase domains
MADLFSAAAAREYKAPTHATFDFPELHGHIALDTENHDPKLKERGSGWAYDRYGQDGGKIIGISIKCDNFHDYVPFGHTEGNCDPVKVKGWLTEQLCKDERQHKIFANSMYDAGWFEAEGIKMKGPLEDIMYMAPLIDENRLNYSLDRLGKDYLGIGKDEDLLLEAGKRLGVKNSKKDNVKAHLMRIHPDIVGVYAKQDTEVTMQLWHHFRKIVEEEELERVYQLEMDLVPMHIAMRMRGVRVDVDEAEQQQAALLKAGAAAKRFIKEQTGLEIGSWDNTAEKAAVFRKLGFEIPKTEKGADSVTQGWLRGLKHPVAEALINGSRADNIRTTFVEGSILNLQQRGRIFPNFNQLRSDSNDGASGVIGKEVKQGTKGTVSGRYSSSNPNFQNIPSPERDDPTSEFQLGFMVRSLFLPEEGQDWHGLDYSSQEPRGIVHFAELTHCPKASLIADKFREDPDTDFHLENAKLVLKAVPTFAVDAKSARKGCKTIGLGIAYGMGGGKLAFSLGLPYTMATFFRGEEEIEYMRAGPEAQELMNAFNDHAPYIKALAQKCQNAVRKKGYIVTPLGRRFRFPKDDRGQYMFLNKALNRLIQGTSADMTKLAMRDLWREGILPVGTVHDEIDLSESDPDVVLRAKHIMENALPMNIPILVDVGSGKNWGQSSGKEGGKYYENFLKKKAA